jgi:hypothetical protein
VFPTVCVGVAPKLGTDPTNFAPRDDVAGCTLGRANGETTWIPPLETTRTLAGEVALRTRG